LYPAWYAGNLLSWVGFFRLEGEWLLWFLDLLLSG
jgi:hypothetical protein